MGGLLIKGLPYETCIGGGGGTFAAKNNNEGTDCVPKVKGKKGNKTIIAESQFKSIIKTLGGDYLYEYGFYIKPLHSYECPYHKIIDFVVMLNGDKDYQTFVGVELKTDMADLKGAYGKNFFSFCYNYLLVTGDISARAIRYIESIEDYKHVGILILCEDGSIILSKRATMLSENSEKFDLEYLSAIKGSNMDLIDSVYVLLEENKKGGE